MPRPEDIQVGKRIRQRRLALTLTQEQVAAIIGVKFQQLQKYETGTNRVSCSRLVDLAKALDVSPSYFFEGIDAPSPHNEIKSADELSLLKSFRGSSQSARASILRIAHVCALRTKRRNLCAPNPNEKEKTNG